MSEKKQSNIYRNLLYLTQIGLSMAIPPIMAIWGASWLQERFGLGDWVMLLGILLGIGGMISNLVEYIRLFARRAQKTTPDRTSFNRRW